MGTLNPNEPEQQAQNPSNGSPFGQDPAFPGQNGGGRVGNIFNIFCTFCNHYAVQ